MTATQVAAALGVLRKTLPDLNQTDLTIDGSLESADISDKPLSPEEWAASALDHLAPAGGARKSSSLPTVPSGRFSLAGAREVKPMGVLRQISAFKARRYGKAFNAVILP